MSSDDGKLRVENISWVLPATQQLGGLLLGNVYGANNSSILKEYGVRAVLTTSIETDIHYKATDIPFHLVIQAHDKDNYHLLQHLQQAFAFIDAHRKYTNVYVHCYAGVSRSVAIVTAYLMQKYQWKLATALPFVKAKRIVSKPNQGFMKQLQEYELTLFKEKKHWSTPKPKLEENLHPYTNLHNSREMLAVKPEQVKKRGSELYEPLQNAHLQNSIYQTNSVTMVRSPQRQELPPQYQKPTFQTMEDPMHMLPKKKTLKSHNQIPIPKILGHGKRSQPKGKQKWNDFRSPQGSNLQSMQSTMPASFLSSNQRSSNSSKISITKAMNHNQHPSPNSNFFSETMPSKLQQSKKTSRCLIRPKDLPGYKNY